MQGLRAFDPKTRTVIDLEPFVPDGHLLRDVDRLVEPALSVVENHHRRPFRAHWYHPAWNRRVIGYECNLHHP
jgi:hypothetical protein